MIVNYITNHVYTNFGYKYSSFNFRNEWYTFLKLANKYNDLSRILTFFDLNVLQCIGKVTENTLLVRLRISVCMVNNLSNKYMSPEMKYELIECMWDTYNKFYRAYIQYNAIYIDELPF